MSFHDPVGLSVRPWVWNHTKNPGWLVPFDIDSKRLHSEPVFHSVMLRSPETNNLKSCVVCGVLGQNSPINRELLRTALRLFSDV